MCKCVCVCVCVCVLVLHTTMQRVAVLKGYLVVLLRHHSLVHEEQPRHHAEHGARGGDQGGEEIDRHGAEQAADLDEVCHEHLQAAQESLFVVRQPTDGVWWLLVVGCWLVVVAV